MWLALLAVGRVQVNTPWGRDEDVAGIAGSRQGAGEHSMG